MYRGEFGIFKYTAYEDHIVLNCLKLTSINIPDVNTEIADSMFFNCVSLTSIEITSSVTSIGRRAFCRCPLNELTLLLEKRFFTIVQA